MNNYVKNYKDNNIDTVIKNKDINRTIKGEALIQIFEGNNKVLEAKTENLLHNKAIWDMFIRQFILPYCDSSHNNNLSEGELFGNMLLTLTTDSENANLERPTGDVLGYCNLTKSITQSGTEEGLMLPYSTKFINKIYTFSTEFGVDKCNGTFNTIYLNAPYFQQHTFNKKGIFGQHKPFARINIIPNNISVYIKDTLYCLVNNTMKPYKFYRDIDGNFTLREFGNSIPITTPNIVSIKYSSKNDCIYMADINNKVYEYDNKLTPTGKVINVDTSIIAILEDMLLVRGAGIYSFRFKAYDINTGSFIKEISIEGITDMIEGLITDYNNEYLYIFSTKFNNSNDTLLETVYDRNLNKISECKDNSSRRNAMIPINFLSNNTFLGTDGFLYKTYINFGTMTKLATPITKTLGQTMKITYSFQVG